MIARRISPVERSLDEIRTRALFNSTCGDHEEWGKLWRILRFEVSSAASGVLMLTTSIHLLERVRDQEDQAAWDRFVALYSPVLSRWMRQWGVSPHDSLDVVQDVLVVLLRQLPDFQYDPSQGHFRGWLKTVAWRQVQAHRGARLSLGESPPISDPPAPVDDALEESEHRAYLVRRALELMKGDFEDSTWRACWEHTVSGLSAAEVGQMLGMSEGAVYVAKCRVLRRLREEMQGLLD